MLSIGKPRPFPTLFFQRYLETNQRGPGKGKDRKGRAIGKPRYIGPSHPSSRVSGGKPRGVPMLQSVNRRYGNDPLKTKTNLVSSIVENRNGVRFYSRRRLGFPRLKVCVCVIFHIGVVDAESKILHRGY